MFQYRLGARDVSLLHKVQTGSGTHRVSYSMGAGGCSLGKAVGCEADNSSPFSAEVESMEVYLRPPVCLYGVCKWLYRCFITNVIRICMVIVFVN
jgi:hypothetical protein